MAAPSGLLTAAQPVNLRAISGSPVMRVCRDKDRIIHRAGPNKGDSSRRPHQAKRRCGTFRVADARLASSGVAALLDPAYFTAASARIPRGNKGVRTLFLSSKKEP